MEIYIKNNGLYSKEFENSDERFLSELTDHVHSEAKLAIEGWKSEFGDDLLDPTETDWDNCYDSFNGETEEEIEAENQEYAKELFLRLLYNEVGVKNAMKSQDFSCAR